jgi:hypothetical protein
MPWLIRSREAIRRHLCVGLARARGNWLRSFVVKVMLSEIARLYVQITPGRSILAMGVLQDARKSDRRVRLDLLGQIDSSVSGRGLVTSRGMTAYHNVPRHRIFRRGFSLSGKACQPSHYTFCEIFHAAFSLTAPRRPRVPRHPSGHAADTNGSVADPALAATCPHRCRHRHLTLWTSCLFFAA